MSLSMRSWVSRKAVNKEVQYSNRLTGFTNPIIRDGNMYLSHNAEIGNDLVVDHDLTVKK